MLPALTSNRLEKMGKTLRKWWMLVFKKVRDIFCICCNHMCLSHYWRIWKEKIKLFAIFGFVLHGTLCNMKKVKWSRYRSGVAQRVGRVIALLFHDCSTRRRRVVSSTSRPHFTTGKDPVPFLQEAWWAPGPVWTGGKSGPHRDSIPDRPTHSQSLYRLSYPAHTPCNIVKHKHRSDIQTLYCIEHRNKPTKTTKENRQNINLHACALHLTITGITFYNGRNFEWSLSRWYRK